MASFCLVLTVTVTLACFTMDGVTGHGRMIEPASRNSMWRQQYQNPRNYNDMGLNCGGFTNQFEKFNGRCGVCGDPYQGPRDHEAGGKYARGLVARQYKSGAFINVTLELTSNHMGYFEFRLCPVNDPKIAATQACLDTNVLNIIGHGTRYFIERKDYTINIELIVMLPPKLTCSQCVLQWKWVAGQSMGPDGMGGECLGCGNQENFVNCADIAIGTTPVIPLPMPGPSHAARPVPATVPPPAGPAYNVNNAYKAAAPRVQKIHTMAPPIKQAVPATQSWNQPIDQVVVYTTPSPWQQQMWQQPTNSWQNANSWQAQLPVNNMPPQSPPADITWNTDASVYDSQQEANSNTDPSMKSYPGYEPGEYPEQGEEQAQSSSSNGGESQSYSDRQTPSYRTSNSNSNNNYNNNNNNNNNQYMQGFQAALRQLKAKLGLNQGGMNGAPNLKANRAFSEIARTLQEAQKNTGRGSGPVGPARTGCPGGGQKVCKAISEWTGKVEFDSWCTTTCTAGNCPSNMCSCSCGGSASASGMVCRSVDRAKGEAMDKWCTLNCKHDNCPPDMCTCS